MSSSSTSVASSQPSTAFAHYQEIAQKQGKVSLFGNAVNRVIIKSSDSNPTEISPSSTSWSDRLWSCLRGFSSRISSNFTGQNTLAKEHFLDAIKVNYGVHGEAICIALKKNEQHGLSLDSAKYTKNLSSSRIAKVLKNAEDLNKECKNASS